MKYLHLPLSRFTGSFTCALLLLAAVLPSRVVRGADAPPPPIESVKALQEQLSAYVNQPRFAAATWGVKVVSLESGKTLFANNEGKLHKPASNGKIYTGALALNNLGSNFRIRTSLYAEAKPSRFGTIEGDLIVYGRGDFSMSSRFNNGDYTKGIAQVVDALAAAGVKKIAGDLVGDDSYFRAVPYGGSWTADDLQYYYGAEVSALSLEDNVIDLEIKPGARVGQPCSIVAKPDSKYLKFDNRTTTVTNGGPARIEFTRDLGQNLVIVTGQLPADNKGYTDSVTVSRPAAFFVHQLKYALAAKGIKITGKTRAMSWLDRQKEPLDTAKLMEIGFVESRPMSELVKTMMKPSQNLYAQLLLLQVGKQAQLKAEGRVATGNTEDAGIAALGDFMQSLNIASAEVRMDDGAGLSRSALVTPNATVQLLERMAKHREAAVFIDSLPLAGVDGTLRNRLKTTPSFQNLRAKTGTIRYVNSLSGYVTTLAGERLAFSILLNNYHNTDPKITSREDIDNVAQMIARLNQKSSSAP